MMSSGLLNRRMRLVHLALGLAVGWQVVLWLVSGLFMVWFDIETVRGEHLRKAPASAPLTWSSEYLAPEDIFGRLGDTATEVQLKSLGGETVWQVKTTTGTIMLDATTGQQLTPLPEDVAIRIAQQHYAGGGALLSGTLLTAPPQEYGRPGPVWRVEFGPEDKASFYVDASTGDVKAVRTRLWRIFDFMWGLHIMDWQTRDNFNSWWIKSFAVTGTVLVFAGVGLAGLRVQRWAKKPRAMRSTEA